MDQASAKELKQAAKRMSGVIVLIDDDSEFRNQLTSELSEEGYPVESFESASHAFRYMESKPWSWAPRLVITDIVMDGMGGFQVMRRVEELYPRRNVPCVVVSRLSSADYRYEAEAAGAVAYISKPAKKEEVIKTIDEALGTA